MTVEWFDLGQRLQAQVTGSVSPRLRLAPITASAHPVAVRATSDGRTVTVTAATRGEAPATASGPAALDLLGSLGVTVSAPSPATLVTDSPITLGLLHRLALSADVGSEGDDVAAHIAWWRARSDFPGGRAVVDTIAACRTRWVAGTAPRAEQDPGIWRTWLGVADESVAGVLGIYALLTTGDELPFLSVLAEDDVWSWGAAQNEYADGWDWRRPDTISRAATGLRSRCDAADLYAAALLGDPLFRRRAVHTGHVVIGTGVLLGDRLKRCRVTCGRLDARLRPGNDLIGWVGSPTANAPTFSAKVSAAEVEHGSLVLTLSGLTGPGPAPGEPVTLHAAPPNPHRQRSGRKAYRALFAARRSWLTTGRTPTPMRRDVPLDVLVAGADAD